MYNSYQQKAPRSQPANLDKRRKILLYCMLGGMVLLVLRSIHLQVVEKQFLQNKGVMQQVDTVSVLAYRGKIVDRNGEPLAVSSPVQSIWTNPQELRKADPKQLKQLEVLLGLSAGKVTQLQEPDEKRRFAHIMRKVNPQLAAKVKAMKLPGVYFQREFKRYYPAGAVSAQIVGFTNMDDAGQEGLELGFEEALKERPGKQRVIRDGIQRIIAEVESVREPVDGQDLQLSIDQRIQYLAFKELQAALAENQAKAVTMVVLDAKTGEILAAANQPSFNPNSRKHPKGTSFKNQAITDVFEPGSTVKPFVVAAALEGNYIEPGIEIETHGSFAIGRNVVKDVHNYGTLTLTELLKKSSNVGASKIALQMPPDYFWGVYHKLGFGEAPELSYPGEARGSLSDYHHWRPFNQATVSFGYGVSSSVLQLAKAYTALADDGLLHSVTLLKRDTDDRAVQVFSPKTAQQVRAMLETVVMRDGTAYQARVDGYRVAGKTGTVKKLGEGGKYTEDKYLGVFVGMAPASNPRLVIAVMVDEPSAGKYYGGLVAAPAFSKVMAGALRILGIAPDQEESMPMLLVKKGPA
ncbi:MAG: penicillin-binding protein 2 [Methylococcales bacterium]|nr:penicillin-binding protein 2 [Methylococcales bacterium]